MFVDKKRNEQMQMAAGLKMGDWVLVDGGDNELQPVWLGRAMPKHDWGNDCTKRNVRGGLETIEGVSIGKNSSAINIVWYDWAKAGSDLHYEISRDHPKPVVQHQSCILLTDFVMTQVGGPIEGALREKRTIRVSNSKLHEQEHLKWHQTEKSRVWKIDQAVHDKGLLLKE